MGDGNARTIITCKYFSIFFFILSVGKTLVAVQEFLYSSTHHTINYRSSINFYYD